MVKVDGIAHMHYKISDLNKTEQFLIDYGLVTVRKTETTLFMRGRNGDQPYCYVGELSAKPGLVAIGLYAAQGIRPEDAQSAVAGAQVEDMDWPGGGKRVSVVSPSGIRFDLMFDVKRDKDLSRRGPLDINLASQVVRKNDTVRLERRPSEILRLGHVALAATDPKATLDWLSQSFGLLVSDVITAAGNESIVIGGFLRVDKGDKHVDHHTFGIFISKGNGVHHYSYEVEDFDDLQMGSLWMAEKGYRHHWGVGRHILGSNMFDYWLDPDGNRVEHFTDMDMFDASVPTGYSEATIESICSWGPSLPKNFLWLNPAAPIPPDAQVLSLE